MNWLLLALPVTAALDAIGGGAAESGAAIAMARRNKMDLAVGIALGSCRQIALFVTPVLVLASLFIAPERVYLIPAAMFYLIPPDAVPSLRRSP